MEYGAGVLLSGACNTNTNQITRLQAAINTINMARTNTVRDNEVTWKLSLHRHNAVSR
jgi:hypothetical protein